MISYADMNETSLTAFNGSDRTVICDDVLAYLELDKSNVTKSDWTLPPSEILLVTLGFVAILSNLSTLLAITQIRKNLSTYMKLIISLSVSDILVGLCCVLPSCVDMSPLGTYSELCLFIHWRSVRITAWFISLLNLLGLGLDHYYAIIRPLQYMCRMSSFRSNFMIASFWISSLLSGFSDFFVPSPYFLFCSITNYSETHATVEDSQHSNFSALLFTNSQDYSPQDFFLTSNNVDVYSYDVHMGPNHSQEYTTNMDFQSEYDEYYDYLLSCIYSVTGNMSGQPAQSDIQGFCNNVYCSKYDSEYLVFILTVCILFVIIFLYTKVCMKIYALRNFRGRNQRTLRRNKRGLITTLCILGTFMACWLPYCIYAISINVMMHLDVSKRVDLYNISVKLDLYLFNILILNSMCDSLIYALRMREIRTGYRRLAKLFCVHFSHRFDIRSQMSIDNYSSSYGMTTSVIRKNCNGRSRRGTNTNESRSDRKLSHGNSNPAHNYSPDDYRHSKASHEPNGVVNSPGSPRVVTVREVPMHEKVENEDKNTLERNNRKLDIQYGPHLKCNDEKRPKGVTVVSVTDDIEGTML